VLLRHNIAIDTEIAPLVADAVQATLQTTPPTRPVRRHPRGPAVSSEPLS